MNWKNKKILVTGSEGMIGKELCKQLYKLGAIIIPFDLQHHPRDDITQYHLLEEIYASRKIDYVFHLFGIKGNPKRTKEKPLDFMAPMLQGDTNSILLAHKYGVEKFLYTSSIAVENPESDFYPAWAKMTAENLIEAIRIQGSDTKYCIVRPSNVYGKEDLNKEHLMVVSSLIKQVKEKGKIVLDEKGSEQTRDIIHAQDVARGMIKAMEKMPNKPVNLCSGKETSVDDIANTIADELGMCIIYKNLNLVLGPDKKIMKNPYIKPKIKLKEGIKLCLK